MATAHPEFDRFRLRHFLESLPAHEIERHDAPVDLADRRRGRSNPPAGAPYISASMDIVGIRPLMLRGRQQAGLELVARSDLRAIYERESKVSRQVPVAFVVAPDIDIFNDAQVDWALAYNGKRFESVQAALADSPKYFVELMSAVASRDGREVVVALDAARTQGRLTRVNEGRYGLG